MNRYFINILIASISFAVGTFAVILFLYSPSITKETKFEMTQIDGKWKLIPVKELTKQKEFSMKTEPIQEKPKKPFCEDEKILPVWNSILKDISTRQQRELLFYQPNCSDLLEFVESDLNGDGNKEILLRGKYDFCLWNGNCAFWIFESKQKGYRKLLYANDYLEINKIGDQIKSTKTKLFKDIMLTTHLSSSDTEYITYLVCDFNLKSVP